MGTGASMTQPNEPSDWKPTDTELFIAIDAVVKVLNENILTEEEELFTRLITDCKNRLQSALDKIDELENKLFLSERKQLDLILEHTNTDVGKLQAEVARLREALEEIGNSGTSCRGSSGRFCQDIAKQALKEPNHE